tara:strand:- start:14 stop:124 length:111 start_codon:yes stop_codon:yes gene_type:complete
VDLVVVVEPVGKMILLVLVDLVSSFLLTQPDKYLKT